MRKTGIVEAGKTLRQMLEESEALLRETGHFNGLKELPLLETDPLKMEVFHSRLLASLVAARETTRMISGSPIVREVAELCVALFTPDGYCIAQSSGLQFHTHLMMQSIQFMIRNNYEEDVGINEGDLFACNDILISGLHPADWYDIIPIFREGELIGWAVTIIMEVEIGAIFPGCVPSSSVERCTDGFRASCEKIGVNDRIRKDWEIRARHDLRLPDLFLLDRRGAIAACIRVREEVKRVIEEFGLDYYKRATRELIEGEARNQISRVITRCIPGRFQNIMSFEIPLSKLPLPPNFQKDHYVLVPFEFNILSNGRFSIDFDGTGPWGWHSHSCWPQQLIGAFSLALIQTLSVEGKANYGTVMTIDWKVPQDSFLNPSNLYVGTANSPVAGLNFQPTWWSSLSRAFFARGFREEILVGSAGNPGGIYFGGWDHYGRGPLGYPILDFSGGCGSGARGIMDGLDCAFTTWNAEADMGNAEVWELIYPALYIGRNIGKDSCGHGRYRSGNGLLITLLVYKTQTFIIEVAPVNAHEKIVPNTGIFGGMPGRLGFAYYVAEANTKELVEQRKPLVHDEGDPRDPNIKKLIKGDFRELGGSIGMCHKTLKEWDLIQAPSGYISPGGYGDPIERDPGLAKKDLDNGVMTPGTYRGVYCIEAAFDKEANEWKVDSEKTRELRVQRKKERLNRGVPFKEWWSKRREKIIGGDLDMRIRGMYDGSLERSERWAREFRAFWNLPEDFMFRRGDK